MELAGTSVFADCTRAEIKAEACGNAVELAAGTSVVAVGFPGTTGRMDSCCCTHATNVAVPLAAQRSSRQTQMDGSC